MKSLSDSSVEGVFSEGFVQQLTRAETLFQVFCNTAAAIQQCYKSKHSCSGLDINWTQLYLVVASFFGALFQKDVDIKHLILYNRPWLA